MSKYKIAWLPGDGIGIEVLEAAKIVLDKLNLDAEYISGDIGWDFWCSEGDAFPQRTIDLLNSVNAAMFGAITSKPVKAAESELIPALKGKGLIYRSPIVRMRQLFDLYIKILEKKIRVMFDLKPISIIHTLNLRQPIYFKTASYGHFGRSEQEFTWEHTNRIDDIKMLLR